MNLIKQLFSRWKLVYDLGMPLDPQTETTYSVAEAAERMGVTRQRIHQLRQEGRIDCIFDGVYWRVFEHSIGHVRPSARPVGRPQKRPKK